MSRGPASSPTSAPEVVSTFWTWVALVVALGGVAGTLWLSIVLKLIACPLCFYQRTFVMAVAAVLLIGLIAGPRRSGYLSLVTLPLTVGALGVAGLHVYKEYRGDLECPDGVICHAYLNGHDEDDDFYKKIHGVVTAPKESLALLSLLFLVQLVDVIRSRNRGGFGWGALLAALIVGGALSAGSILSAGPGVIPQTGEIVGCRKPQP